MVKAIALPLRKGGVGRKREMSFLPYWKIGANEVSDVRKRGFLRSESDLNGQSDSFAIEERRGREETGNEFPPVLEDRSERRKQKCLGNFRGSF